MVAVVVAAVLSPAGGRWRHLGRVVVQSAVVAIGRPCRLFVEEEVGAGLVEAATTAAAAGRGVQSSALLVRYRVVCVCVCF